MTTGLTESVFREHTRLGPVWSAAAESIGAFIERPEAFGLPQMRHAYVFGDDRRESFMWWLPCMTVTATWSERRNQFSVHVESEVIERQPIRVFSDEEQAARYIVERWREVQDA